MLRSSHSFLHDISNEEQLGAFIEPLRAELLCHPIYSRVDDLPSLRRFMTSHVCAVWDFMTLLKTLQRALTCVETPWLPPSNSRAARLINSIVLGEESDEIAPGQYTSHFELYLAAMDEVGADRTPIDGLIAALRSGAPASDALEAMEVPASTRAFVRATLRTARGAAVHEIAASFLYGREDLVPRMFRRILSTLEAESSLRCPAFRCYLDRHVEVDEQDHSPMAHELLRSLCGDDVTRWAQAAGAAAAALVARRELWDGVLAQIGPHVDARSAKRSLAVGDAAVV